MEFEYNLEYNLLRLCADLNSDNYQHGSYTHKIVNEKKRRDIHVAEVRDRVVHRLVYDYLVPIVDSKFDYDVWSCRKGKGLYSALVRTQQLLSKYPNAWVWRADVTKFFDSVHKPNMEQMLRRHVSDKAALCLLGIVIDSYDYSEARSQKPEARSQKQAYQLAI
jgi:retron-type reverse transcriptase